MRAASIAIAEAGTDRAVGTRGAPAAREPADDERPVALGGIESGRQHAGVVAFRGTAVGRVGNRDNAVPGRRTTSTDC
ncbi:MAG TPA: hypothetical protein VMA95_17115 [Streptosporangiaceae bacterium]|nr:hypothetical protein [Streptosporangiaceae bacterium]